MSDFFIVVEIIKYYTLDPTWLMIHSPFVYKVKVKTNTILSSYFTDIYGAEDLTGKEILNIKGLIVNYDTNYSRQLSITDCQSNEESFYFDIDEQMLYVHYEHTLNPYTQITEMGKVFGYTNDTIRDFNGIYYRPEVISIPNLQIKADPLKYTQQGFYGGDVVMNNNPVYPNIFTGEFDSNQELTGNDIFIYFGENGDDYDDLILISNNYIYNSIISYNTIIIKTKDKREQQSKKIPQDTFSVSDFPDMDPELEGEIKPDAYGNCIGIPGICVNSEQAGAKEFYFASIIKSSSPSPSFYSIEDDVYTLIVPTATDYSNGLATFAVADIHIDGDSSKGILDVICNGTFRDFHNPADIIADMNDEWLNITYNSSNYNTTEWADEKQYLDNVMLYMPDAKQMYEYIEELQNGSTIGFMYFFDNEKRTIRLDNPNRDSSKYIDSIEVLNDFKFNNNFDFFATHVLILYRYDVYRDRYFYKWENTDYYDSVYAQHRMESEFQIKALLRDLEHGEDKSYIIMEDLQKERPTGKILCHGKAFFQLRLFDIIEVNTNRILEKKVEEIPEIYISTDDDDPELILISSDQSGLDWYISQDYTIRTIEKKSRDFLGELRCQIIGLTPNFNNGTIEIEIRQRDYSDVYETITGYTP